MLFENYRVFEYSNSLPGQAARADWVGRNERSAAAAKHSANVLPELREACSGLQNLAGGAHTANPSVAAIDLLSAETAIPWRLSTSYQLLSTKLSKSETTRYFSAATHCNRQVAKTKSRRNVF